mmetsp:Transcript_9225/g.13370  ORF Transcript_9225/g.13370 Transcript_9225/m.13370 type:complete len:149 (+) Transcript_9225:256-702(+)
MDSSLQQSGGKVGRRRVGDENEGPVEQHPRSKFSSNRGGLRGEVPEHFITSPATDETNAVRVNLGTEEGHGTTGAKGTGGDIRGDEAIAGPHGENRTAELSRDMGGGDAKPPSAVEVGMERGGTGGLPGTESKDTANHGENRAPEGMT